MTLSTDVPAILENAPMRYAPVNEMGVIRQGR